MAARNGVIIPNEVLSDISDFIPRVHLKNLTFLSRTFAAVTVKRLPIINAREKFLLKIDMHCIFWEHRLIERHFNQNPELTTEKLDEISAELQYSGYLYIMDKTQIELYWSVLQDWTKIGKVSDNPLLILQNWREEGKMSEDPLLEGLQEEPIYKEDPEGFWAFSPYEYVSHMDTHKIMSVLSKPVTYAAAWEIIDVLYRDNPELNQEKRDQICADFQIDKLLIEAYWSAFRLHHESRQVKPKVHPLWEWPMKWTDNVNNVIDGIEKDRNTKRVKMQAIWCRVQRDRQRTITKLFDENPVLSMERLTQISAKHEIDKKLIEGYWSVLHRKNN